MSEREGELWGGACLVGAGSGILLATILHGFPMWITGVAWVVYGVVVLLRTRYEIVNVRKERA